MRIKYNAPTTLTYAFFCTLVVSIDQFALHGFTRAFFTVPNALAFDLTNPLSYLRLFTHIAGHADWSHLMSNMAYILLLGPMLEETYGSLTMFLMIVVTGFVTGVLNACFFTHPLLGASGVVFMMILLASFANSGKDEIPLTFILIMILYLGREILNAFRGDDISQFAHLAGGLCGSLFGFFKPSKSGAARKSETPKRVAPIPPAPERATPNTSASPQKSGKTTAKRSRETAKPDTQASRRQSSAERSQQNPAKKTKSTRAAIKIPPQKAP